VSDPATEPDSASASRGGFYLLAFIAAFLIVAAYANSLHNDFHFDDGHVIVNNVYIHSLRNIPLFFTDAHTFSSLPQNSTYRPLVTLSFAVDYAAGHGLDPVAFHVTQIALLIAVWGLLIAFYRGLLDLSPAPVNRLIALASATLFAVHTANTETMNFLSCRSELLSAIGLLAAFLLVQRSPVARRYHLYLLPLAFGALAKAPIVIFAPLLMVYVFLFSDEPRSWGRAFRAALPSLVTGVGLLLFLNSMNAKEWTSGGGSTLRYALTQPFVWVHYARLFFLPIGLTADTDMRLFEHWYDTRAIIGFVFVLVLLAAIHRLSMAREHRPIAFGLAWFAIALIPTSSFFPLAEVANEHRIFFPYIGLALAVVYAVSLAARRIADRAGANPSVDGDPTTRAREIEVTAAVGIVLIIVAHVIGARARNETWRTEESLWRDTAEKSPENGRALMNYGLTQMAQGKYAIARSYFERASVFNPNYSTLQINLGVVDGALGMRESAEEHFRAAIRLNDDANGHYFYGRWLVQNGRGPDAVAHLARALVLAPGSAEVRSLMMQIDAARGADAELQAVARQSLAIDPGNGAASSYATGTAPFRVARNDYAGWFGYGIEETRNGHDLEAAIVYRQALKFDPRSSDALNNLGWSLARLGFRAEARDAFTRALTIRPDYELARNNLRWVESLR
jgi:protein O-mannosyl-transferase